MASLRASTFSLIFFLAGWLVSAAGQDHQNHHDSHEEPHLHGQVHVSINASLMAPYYRYAPAGGAWVLPKSVYDLGARDMRCECFNPDGKFTSLVFIRQYVEYATKAEADVDHGTETCCMPKSKGLAPFCIPKGAACCSDTFCNADEACCADACCKSVSWIPFLTLIPAW